MGTKISMRFGLPNHYLGDLMHDDNVTDSQLRTHHEQQIYTEINRNK